METQELLKRVRKIEIKTKGLTNQIFSGGYHSAFKGRGMSFAEVREYTWGDDVRSIDWNVTAKTNVPHIKVFEEERELTVMLMIDISRSLNFGDSHGVKKEIAAEISAILALSAISNNDKVGAILFSDKIHKYIPPKKGKKHGLLIIRELLNTTSNATTTSLSQALQYCANVQKKKAIIFCVSDFIDNAYHKEVNVLSRKHDLVGIRLHHPLESQWNTKAVLRIRDAESRQSRLFNTQLQNTMTNVSQYHDNFTSTFRKYSADTISIDVTDDYVKSLMSFFKYRISH